MKGFASFPISSERLLPPTGSVAEIGERVNPNRLKPDFLPSAGHQAIEAPTGYLKARTNFIGPNFEGGQASGYRKFGWSVISGSNNRHWDRHGPARIDDIGVSVVTSRYDTPTELPVAASLAPLKIGAVGHGPARIDDIGGNEIPRQFVDGPVE
ncbi:hypothetical protein E4U36_007969 [Claviceps purpurea]|nr:hypothetical protein E4U36_007969 [Claviceps purpurea]